VKGRKTGGLARRATVFRKYLSRYRDVLILETGDVFFKRTIYDSIETKREKEKAYLIINAYNFLKYDALNIGGKDLILGTKFPKELS